MSAAADDRPGPAGREPEPPTAVAPAVGAAGGHDAALGAAGEPPSAVSAETLLPGDGPSEVQGAGAEAGSYEPPPQPGSAEPPPFVPTPPAGGEPDAGDDFSASDAGLLERRPEIGLAAGFTGGFLLATILRRLGR